MLRLRIRYVVLGVPALAAFQACGPSMQTIYEGNVRFEHCYRLDLDDSKAPSHRHACWQNWLRVYAYAQPRDRIEYARRRIRSLQTGDPERPTLNFGQEGQRGERHYYLSGPNPLSAHTPPPALAENWGASGAQGKNTAWGAHAPDAGQSSELPGQPCSQACSDDFRACAGPCGQADGGANEKSCNACQPDYVSCMQRCLRDLAPDAR